MYVYGGASLEVTPIPPARQTIRRKRCRWSNGVIAWGSHGVAVASPRPSSYRHHRYWSRGRVGGVRTITVVVECVRVVVLVLAVWLAVVVTRGSRRYRGGRPARRTASAETARSWRLVGSVITRRRYGHVTTFSECLHTRCIRAMFTQNTTGQPRELAKAASRTGYGRWWWWNGCWAMAR